MSTLSKKRPVTALLSARPSEDVALWLAGVVIAVFLFALDRVYAATGSWWGICGMSALFTVALHFFPGFLKTKAGHFARIVVLCALVMASFVLLGDVLHRVAGAKGLLWAGGVLLGLCVLCSLVWLGAVFLETPFGRFLKRNAMHAVLLVAAGVLLWFVL